MRTKIESATPNETTSRLIADVQLDEDSPLEPGVVATGRVPTVGVLSAAAS